MALHYTNRIIFSGHEIYHSYNLYSILHLLIRVHLRRKMKYQRAVGIPQEQSVPNITEGII